MFPGDLPIVDKPLPRFLDDAAAAKLLRAARSDADPLSRLIVELLARTGIRRGELLALTVDAVVQIGSAYWLRIPIGKLHNDRYIPLHPQLKQLLDDWITHHRPTGLRTNRLLLEHNRPISSHRVTAALRRTADAAGIGYVTAHQLRHTLATQAVNRGMSLDAIAALLGHKTLAMTMVYARIADKTVADEYFAVTEKVEALYGQPSQLASRRRRPRDAQAPQRNAPAHARQRLLRTTGRDGLPLRVHLRIVQLLRHHHRVPAHPATTARRRRPQGPNRPPEDLRRHPQPPRHQCVVTAALDTITRISTTSSASCTGSDDSHPPKPRPSTIPNT